MPIYEFQCGSCGLRFEKLYKAVSDVGEIDCECGASAKKQMSAVSFSFSHVPVGGPRPQNTGVHSIDYNMDQVIGRDAEMRWKAIEERKAHKEKVSREHHKEGGQAHGMQHVVRDGSVDGGYRTMQEPERQYINERRVASAEVAKAAAGQKDDG